MLRRSRRNGERRPWFFTYSLRSFFLPSSSNVSPCFFFPVARSIAVLYVLGHDDVLFINANLNATKEKKLGTASLLLTDNPSPRM